MGVTGHKICKASPFTERQTKVTVGRLTHLVSYETFFSELFFWGEYVG